MMYPPNLHSRYLERRRYSKGRVGTAASEGSGTMREKHEHLRILECFISVARCRNSTHTKTYYYSCIKARIRQLVRASNAVAFTIFRCFNGGNGCEVPRSLSQPPVSNSSAAYALSLLCFEVVAVFEDFMAQTIIMTHQDGEGSMDSRGCMKRVARASRHQHYKAESHSTPNSESRAFAWCTSLTGAWLL